MEKSVAPANRRRSHVGASQAPPEDDAVFPGDLRSLQRAYLKVERSRRWALRVRAACGAIILSGVPQVFFILSAKPHGYGLWWSLVWAALVPALAVLPLAAASYRRSTRRRNAMAARFFEAGLRVEPDGSVVTDEAHPRLVLAAPAPDAARKIAPRPERPRGTAAAREERTAASTLAGMLAVAAALLLGLAVPPMDSLAHLTAVSVLLGIMWYSRVAAEGRDAGIHRVLVLILGAFVTVRYIVWRGMYTLEANDLVGFVFALLLYAAEIYSAIIHIVGCVVNVQPLRRSALTMADLPAGAPVPTVDVMVPSYNEDPALLEVTLRAALRMRYPADKLRVHLLDDGGTDEKIAQADPIKAAAARERRARLQALCRRLGANYITRPRNEGAKAGNINHGLRLTDGDLVAILDADHVPTVDFLDHTVPWFVRYDDVFLVQTPHFMANPDPIERNLLRLFRRMPSENDMFYRTVQRGLDFWSCCSFFCGSAAVLRRRHLEEIGGLAGDSVTEDIETALALHRRGYRSIYVDKPMVAALTPETFTGLITQRTRWAQGMLQILLLKRPLLGPGLRWHQRLGYMNSLLFWLFPFARAIFLTAPLAYLVFGLRVYNASLREIVGYTVPHVIAIYMVSALLFGRMRWPLISELYEVVQCPFLLRAAVRVLLAPRKPAFVVTPKGESLERDFLSPLARPFYFLFWLVLLGFVFGAWRFHAYPMARELTGVVLAWNLFNFITVLAALGVLHERRQRRGAPRVPVREPAFLVTQDGTRLACTITDISAGGARLCVAADAVSSPPAVGDRLQLLAYSHPLGRVVELPVELRAITRGDGAVSLGVRFSAGDERLADEAVILAFGDSGRWQFFQDRRSRPVDGAVALGMVLRQVWEPLALHGLALVRSRAQHLRRLRSRLVHQPPATGLVPGGSSSG